MAIMKQIIPRLGVNIDHVATVRNARGGKHPCPVRAALAAKDAGADSITAHLREDRRHIRDEDILRLRQEVDLPLNMEMAATREMLEIALRVKPHAVCIVPERREEITTEGGLDAILLKNHLRPLVARLADAGIRVSLFINPDIAQVRGALEAEAEVVEFHTGKYAHGKKGEIEKIREAVREAGALGLECHAGHGLDFGNARAIAEIPGIVELNIGHFLVGEALFTGLGEAVSRMKRIMAGAE